MPETTPHAPAAPHLDSRARRQRRPRTRLWWVSLVLSLVAFVSPWVFAQIPGATMMTAFAVCIPLGIIAGACAVRVRSWWLLALAVLAAIAPFVMFWAAYAVLFVLYVITLGKFPGADWV
ncbi:hypothetical protein C1Y63_02025 [Corynebacterium sp. 13CS0277]|uniref:hypothetical protein n=1 Tax=Corynebacterium sp. 13CS0277 TaxID=2071994 RepID=UPI000D0334B0|nr:hypothetical protein [Corynebacterium sp. 13CS0277]PRQ12350.1 hypothetical protein C1Y63_02025 [Corynebacterium sp. 13CS0277]